MQHHTDDDFDAELDEPFYDQRGPDEEPLRDRCLFGPACVCPHPFHGPGECWTAEMVEAFEAELDARELGAGDA